MPGPEALSLGEATTFPSFPSLASPQKSTIPWLILNLTLKTTISWCQPPVYSSLLWACVSGWRIYDYWLDVSSHVPGAKTIGQAVDKFLNSLREMASPVTFWRLIPWPSIARNGSWEPRLEVKTHHAAPEFLSSWQRSTNRKALITNCGSLVT